MATPAAAQTTACSSRENMVELLEQRFLETPAATALEASGRIIELFTSEDGATWTLAFTDTAGMTCVIAVGDDWQPLDPPTPAVPTDGA